MRAMWTLVTACALLVLASAMPVDYRSDAADITELGGSALLEAQQAVGVRADEQFDTAPYKFFLWNPTGAGHVTAWGPRRGPQELITKLRAAITGAGLAAKCGATARCVLLGPEFVGQPQDQLSVTEYAEWKRDLKTLSAEPANMNLLLAPGTFVYRAKGSPQQCQRDALVVWPTKKPALPDRVWYGTEAGWRGCTYAFNVLVAAFRGNILIEHYKVVDGGTADRGAAFDAAARPDLLRVTRQSSFRVAAWNILVGVEICADHGLHRVKRATNDQADLQLSIFYPGGISTNSIAQTGVKDGAFVVQNGGVNRNNQVFKRNGQALQRFYLVPPHPNQVGVDRGLDIFEYIGAAPQAPPQPQQPGGLQPPRTLTRQTSGGLRPRSTGPRPPLQRSNSVQLKH